MTTDILLWACVPTTVALAILADTMIAVDFIWRLFISLNEGK
jgi:hypothetical protein